MKRPMTSSADRPSSASWPRPTNRIRRPNPARRTGRRRGGRASRGRSHSRKRQSADFERQHRGWYIVDVHEFERLAADDALALELAAIGQHLGEAEIVADGREQADAAARAIIRRVHRVALRHVEPVVDAAHPRDIFAAHGRPSRDQSGRPYTAATRLRFSGGTLKSVSFIPKGSNRRSRRTALTACRI